MILADLKPDETGTVLEMDMNKAVTNRLVAMGFTPGVLVTMVQNYGHGPMIVLVRETRVALGRGEARHIRIERSAA